jgi:RNA polymerase sigma-70 factor (ECF subfamily)
MGMATALAAGSSWIEQRRMEAEKAPSSLETAREREEEFVAAHLRRVFLLIYRIVGNAADAQDLTQEAFVKALGRRDQLKDPEKAAQWLGRIASNTAIDFVRQRRRVTFNELESIPEPSHHEHPERLVLRSEKQAYLADGLRLLSERERAALILRDVEGLPAAEVAEQLGCSMATVRSHIANARTKFRKYFKGRKQ